MGNNKNELFAGSKCPVPITAKEWREMNDGDDAEGYTGPVRMREIVYVPEKLFSELRQKFKQGSTITREEADGLVNADLPDDEMYVPVDTQVHAEDLEDYEVALDTLGPRKFVEYFINALEHFEKFKHEFPEDKLPKPITSKEWKDMDDDDDDGVGEGEETDSDEKSDAEGDDAEEHPAKKAKNN